MTREPEDLPGPRKTKSRAGDPLGETMTIVNTDHARRATVRPFHSFDMTRWSQAVLLVAAGVMSLLCWAGLAALMLL